MGRGLTAGTILAGVMLMAYIFTRQGREVGDRGLAYVQGALDGVTADEDEERKDGEGGTPAPDVDPPEVAPPQGDPTPGPPTNVDTGAAQSGGTVTIDDDDPQPGATEPSGQGQELDLDQGGRGLEVDVAPVEPTPSPTAPPAGGQGRAPAPVPTPAQHIVNVRNYLQSRGIDANEYLRRNKRTFDAYLKTLPKSPSPASQAAAQAPASRPTPQAQAQEARERAAFFEGRAQAARPATRSIAPRKPGLYQSSSEILARYAGYLSEERGL